MGLLTTDQQEAIATGAPIRQKFTMILPSPSGTNVFHDDDAAQGGPKTVLSAGKRKHSAYNVSMAKPGNIALTNYDFVVDNSDGKFYDGDYSAGGYFAYGASGYYPFQCWVKHQVYVWANEAWSELVQVSYTGKIVDCEYSDTGNDAGAAGKIATISTQLSGSFDILNLRWAKEHGDDTDTGIDILMRP